MTARRAARSAGLLLWRRRGDELQAYLAHMGGPYWRGRQAGAWTIPKGEFDDADEPALELALREFAEEIGRAAPAAPYALLGEYRQRSGKVVVVFAAEAEFEAGEVRSNTFPLEWPPRSGRIVEFPEVDDARWIGFAEARQLLVSGQAAALDAVEAAAGGAAPLR